MVTQLTPRRRSAHPLIESPPRHTLQISVLIPAHNPDAARLRAVLLALRKQTLPMSEWETVLINNASSHWPDQSLLTECAPRNLSIVDEPLLGLSAARRRGFRCAKGEIAVLVDDDNVLAPDYLTAVAALFSTRPKVGVMGGKSLPLFAAEPPAWTREFYALLALRDLGDYELVTNSARSESDGKKEYPAFAPIGAGMAVRRSAWNAWLQSSPERSALTDRRGTDLSSGGDNDIVLCAMAAAWNVGYFPQLRLSHIIPAQRLETKYLGRLNRSIQRSWIQVLARHELCPWTPLSPEGAVLREWKAWLTHRPWTSDAAYVRFQGVCGHFEGRVTPQLTSNQAVVPATITRSLSRRLGLGRISYGLWHAPRGAFERAVQAGGPIEQWIDRRGRIAMERAAKDLPTSLAAPSSQVELNFLTGKKFWYQTAFCLHSLQHHSGRTFPAIFHDDGTLDEPIQEQLRALFPAAEIRVRKANDERLAALLPPARFPFLHGRRQHYPNILKLTDVHVGRSGPRLVLDSDMLFFRRPEFVLQWLAAPDRSLHMLDLANAYGYSTDLMRSLAGHAIPRRVNVGLTGLRSDSLDWEQLESWCRRLIEAEGTHYYLEQALVAMLMAAQSPAVAPEQEYVIAPTPAECHRPTAVLHHYVANSKRWYFRETWRSVPRQP